MKKYKLMGYKSELDWHIIETHFQLKKYRVYKIKKGKNSKIQKDINF